MAKLSKIKKDKDKLNNKWDNLIYQKIKELVCLQLFNV